MTVRTTPGIHNLRTSAKTVTNRLREIGEDPHNYAMYILYAAFHFWTSIYECLSILKIYEFLWFLH